MTDYSRLSDDALLGQTKRDADAFGAFYRRHARAVLNFAVRELHDTERALDLTAEVFAAALAASGRFRPGGPPAQAWLFGIARNKLAAMRRRDGAEVEARHRLGMPVRAFSDEVLERTEEMLDASVERHMKGVAALPRAEREAVIARVLEDRDYAEIAASADSTEAAIRQRVSRGLSKLARRGDGEDVA